MGERIYIQCPNCNGIDKFTLVKFGEKFAVVCSFCESFIRNLPTWRLAEDKGKDLKEVAMPYGKYKGVKIFSLVRQEEISYLIWLQRSEGWAGLNDTYKDAIRQHLSNHQTQKRDGTLLPNEERKPKEKKFNPLEVFEKNFDPDDLSI